MVSENVDGTTSYVDFDGIRKVGGFVYFWELNDYSKPSQEYLSDKIYHQVDCKLNRVKNLRLSFYVEPMGRGIGETLGLPDEWKDISPNSVEEIVLEKVCNDAN